MHQPEEQSERRSRMRWIALLEAGLALLGAGLAWLMGVPLLGMLSPTEGWAWAIGRGLLAALPLVALLALARQASWGPIARFRRQVKRILRAAFPRARVGELLLVSLAAGIGEEVLFRGVLQYLLIQWLGVWPGLGLASLAFGLVHPISVAYVAVATFGGAYFGWLAVCSPDHEIVSAITAHAAYDFVALMLLTRREA
ncbi:CAAX amino terminal protease self- immunity [Pirellulimonas nuda]|uniref:CAAX amino terminal protease self-immunity n=1 Tax=Pirellulimonas nuda TaxID=2528009 RepID=A0A518DHW0_9BACT|nr:CPBP family intramembrane glutamic endopeptidase [Pirellulimonas nuda]QDU91067.1 CAAX amino terminal protease self- immunity [Pirellulimonas nuda]